MNIYVSKEFEDNEVIENGIRFKTLINAVDNIKDGDCIFLENEIYYGKIYISKNNISIYGKDRSIITYDASHKEKIRDCDKKYFEDKETYGTTGSASVTVSGKNFNANNVTFENGFKRVPGITNGQAVALKVTGDNSKFNECKFIGSQDTLYVDELITARFKNCYIEGDVDFIFGSGNALFEYCDILAKYNSNGSPSYITAASTLASNEFGFLFYSCKFFTNKNEAYLSRPWYPNKEYDRVPRICFLNCYFDEFIILGKKKMNIDDPDNDELIYNACIQNDEVVSNSDDIKKYLKFI